MKNQKAHALTAWLIFILAGNIFWLCFVRAEDTVYSYDSGNYWQLGAEFWHLLKTDCHAAYTAMSESIAHADYNYLGAAPIAIARGVFGPSRTVYMLTVFNLYMIPGLVALTFLTAHLARVTFYRASLPVLAVCFFCSALWLPLGFGYIDCFGLALIFTILRLHFDKLYFDKPHSNADAERENSLIRTSLISLLLVGLALFRRWYLFWVESFFIVVFVQELAKLRAPIRPWLKRWALTSLLNGSLGYFTGFLLFAALSSPAFFFSAAARHYSDLYSAFRDHSSRIAELHVFIERSGAAWILLLIAAICALWQIKRYRGLLAALILQTLIIFTHFTSIQSFYMHQYYGLLSQQLIVLTLIMVELQQADLILPFKMKSNLIYLTLVALGAVSTFVFLSSSNSARQIKIIAGGWLSYDQLIPYVRRDMSEVRRLAERIEKLSQEAGQKTFYTLSESETLNSSTLPRFELSQDKDVTFNRRLLATADIDRRDGFPNDLLRADYVIVANPLQVDFGEAHQQVVAVPYRQLTQHQAVGAAFEPLNETFTLADAQHRPVTIKIYQKIRALTQTEIKALSDELRSHYPDQPYIYQPTEWREESIKK